VLCQVRNELEGLTFHTNNGTAIPGELLIPHGLQNQYSVATNIGILVAMMVGMRLLAFLFTLIAARIRFL
jgi:hypothetical protein